VSNATQLCGRRTAISTRMPPSSLARRLPVLAACIPKVGCPLCYPALAALCSLCGLPFATLNPLLIGVTLLGIALLLITAVSRHTFSWPSGLLVAGLFTNLGARFWAVPVWFGYVAAALVLTGFVAEILLPRRFVTTSLSPHCTRNCHAVFVSRCSEEEA